MPSPPDLQPRKQPQQERSRQMRQRILDAGIRVLARHGALGFTTTRVAYEADISVGSLYQYFPNKHALVMAIHERYVEQGWHYVATILADADRSPRRKLIDITRWFFETEAGEAAELGAVVGDIDVFLHHRPADHDLDEAVAAELSAALGLDPDATRYVMTVVESVGKATAALDMAADEVMSWADRTAQLLADHYELA